MKCYLLIFSLSAFLLHSVNEADQKQQSIAFLSLFCFLGWSLGICILLGTHSDFILKYVNIEQNSGAGQET